MCLITEAFVKQQGLPIVFAVHFSGLIATVEEKGLRCGKERALNTMALD
jgi:hypothetical protein